MKKKAFISVYVLLLLLVLSITISFAYQQSINDDDFNKDLYDKKKSIYRLESIMNICLSDKDYIDSLIRECALKKRTIYDNAPEKDIKVIYDNKEYTIRFDYYKNYSELYTKVNIGQTVATGVVRLEEDYKLDVLSKDIIKYDFKDKLTFFDKSYETIKADNLEDFDLSKDIIEIDGDLLIRNEESNKKITKDKFSGILIINGDLIIEKDFSIDGLLIIKGNLIRKENEKVLNPKLKVIGQIISKNDLDKECLDFEYNDNLSYDKLKSIDNIYDTKVVLKKIY